ncbi:MAG: hypothetical protein ACD_21C00037G0001 [uncultured bacterium]|nr:MAG: hypothetical protein ACD_21C00037G0001 [uncultured bacterium]
MFFYLYDEFVRDKKNETVIRGIENRIIELGINGRVERLQPLRNLKEIITVGLKQKVHTFVVVGSDATLLHAINILADEKVALGFIPLGQNSSRLGELFGIHDALEACNALSRRITKPVPLAKANQTHFLTELSFPAPVGTVLHFDNGFSITSITDCHVKVSPQPPVCCVTIQPDTITKRPLWGSPPPPLTPTTLTTQRLTVEPPEKLIEALLDYTTTIKAPLTITLKAKPLKVIVGKDRGLI